MTDKQLKDLLMRLYLEYNADKTRDIQQWIQDIATAIVGHKQFSITTNLTLFSKLFADIAKSVSTRRR